MKIRCSDHVAPCGRRACALRVAAGTLAALLLVGCEAPTKGFSGPGCYDYRGVRDAAVPTEAECRALNMEWLTAPPPGMRTVP